MSYFYMSFCHPDKPKGTQFVGCTIVEADCPHHAVQKAWQLNINPGGEVAFCQFEVLPEDLKDMVNRLVPRIEAMERGRLWDEPTS